MKTVNVGRSLGARRVSRIRLIGVFTLGLCLIALGYGDSARNAGRIRDVVFDMYQRAMPRPVPLDKFPATIVQIDQASLNAVGPWPWPRNRLAELARKIRQRGAYVVGFDVVFPEPDRYGAASLARVYPHAARELAGVLDPDDDPDKVFAKVVGDPESYIVLGRAGTVEVSDATTRDPDKLYVPAPFSGAHPTSLLAFEAAVTNILELDFVAPGIGLLNGPPDPDGVIRRAPVVAQVAGKLMPSLALEMIRVATIAKDRLGPDQIDKLKFELDVSGGRLRAVRLSDLVIPVQPDGRMLLHFSEPVAGRITSAAAVMDGSAAPDFFKDKLVIIGLGSVGVEDVVSTPIVSRTYGADIHAQLIEAISARQWLTRPHWAPVAEWLVTVLLGLGAALGLPKLTSSRALAVTVAGGAAVLGLSIAAFALGKAVIDATLPLIGAGVPAAVTLGAILVETERRRRGLRTSLIERRVEAAAAGRIQSGMLPSAASLKALPGTIDLWPVLEPADAIGGDLYDVFMLDDHRLYFVVGDVTGKGMPAALFMSLAKALTKSIILRAGAELETAIADVNAEISRDNPDELFVTALLGVLDLRTGEAALCNAGHENPIVMRADGTVSEFAMEGGPPLCAFEGFVYPIETVTLRPGDRLVIISDGVSEATDPRGTLFGRGRIAAALRSGRSGETSQQTASRLITAVRRFEAGRPAGDDLTVMVIGYNG